MSDSAPHGRRNVELARRYLVRKEGLVRAAGFARSAFGQPAQICRWGRSPTPPFEGSRPLLSHGYRRPKEKGLMVRKEGLEPSRCYPQVPETCASTSSATFAVRGRIAAERQQVKEPVGPQVPA